MQSDKPLCIIPARGCSKRFPRKNVALLGGKPLLAWTIEAALEADIFDTIWVSSEDEDILDIAEHFGGKALLRSQELAGDRVTVRELCLQIVRDFSKAGSDYSALYTLLPTSPFRKAGTIRKAWNTFCKSDAEALMSVVPYKDPPQWAFVISNGFLRPFMPEEVTKPRIDIETLYIGDGGHCIVDISCFIKTESFICPRTLAFPVTFEEAFDIDEPNELTYAGFLLQQRKG